MPKKEGKEKHGNTKGVIAVATLLVAVVGATFAYFTATNTPDGSAAKEATVDTAKVANISFTKEAIEGTKFTVYPGTMNAVGAGFKSNISGGSEGEKYKVSYDVKATVSLLDGETGLTGTEFDFPVKWRLYRLDEKLDNSTDGQKFVTCENVKALTSGDQNNEVHYTQKCTENTKFVDSGDLGTKTLVASGKIEKATGDSCTAQSSPAEGQIACGNKADITFEDNVTIDTNGANKYYYLVVEYPTVAEDDGSDKNQNADMGKKIKLEINDISVTNTEKADA